MTEKLRSQRVDNEHAGLSYSFTQIVDMNGAEKKYT